MAPLAIEAQRATCAPPATIAPGEAGELSSACAWQDRRHAGGRLPEPGPLPARSSLSDAWRGIDLIAACASRLRPDRGGRSRAETAW